MEATINYLSVGYDHDKRELTAKVSFDTEVGEITQTRFGDAAVLGIENLLFRSGSTSIGQLKGRKVDVLFHGVGDNGQQEVRCKFL